jgi:hypothetical protein
VGSAQYIANILKWAGSCNLALEQWNSLQWRPSNASPPTQLRVVIIQRLNSRKIKNIAALVSAARSVQNITDVSVAVMENMTMQEQIRMITCGHVIVAGAQGAGLQWTSFLKYTGRPAALIEFTWRSWPPFYSSTQGKLVHYLEQNIPDQDAACPAKYNNTACCNDCDYKTKFFDIIVDEAQFKQNLGALAHKIGAPP